TLAGCTPDGDAACHDVWQDLRAVTHASGPVLDAPALLVHFSDDLVPAAHAEEYRAAQLARGATANDVQLYVVKGQGHGLDGMAAPGIEPLVRAWLNARLGAAAAPSPCGPVDTPTPAPVPVPGGCCGGRGVRRPRGLCRWAGPPADAVPVRRPRRPP